MQSLKPRRIKNMRITIEVDFEVEEHIDDNNNVTIRAMSLPDCRQNLMPNLSPQEIARAQQEVEAMIEQATLIMAAAIRERREMAGDARRERMRDDKMTRDIL